MRLILEIVIVGALVALFFMFRAEYKDTISDKQQSIERFEDSLSSLDEQYRKKDSALGQLRDSVNYFDRLLTEKENEQDSIEKVYNQKISRIESQSLENLIDSTQRIIKVKNNTYVVVTEAFYRKARRCNYKLEKLQAKITIYKDKISIKDSIIDIKDESIMELMDMVAIQKQKVHLKDSVITKQDLIIENKNDRIGDLKLQRIIGGGVATGIILLILL